MRVIAGLVGGRRLLAPEGQHTRPTSDRVKEALFSALEPYLEGARVLDLYAGSGALGIEALSRGAVGAVFVERDRRAAELIRRNLEAVGLSGGVRRVTSVEQYCRAPVDGPFDIVLADPPYDMAGSQILACLDDLATAGGMSATARVVVERRRSREALPSGGGVAWERTRTYGDTTLIMGKAKETRS